MALSNETSISLENLNEYDSTRFRDRIRIGINTNNVSVNASDKNEKFVSIGHNVTSSPYSIAIGSNVNTACNANANFKGGIAIGTNINSYAANSVIVGTIQPIAIGKDIETQYGIAIGSNCNTQTYGEGIALGANIVNSNAGKTIGCQINNNSRYSVALGRDITINTSATYTDSAYAVVIGSNISLNTSGSMHSNDVAIGSNMVTLNGHRIAAIGTNIATTSRSNDAIAIGSHTRMGGNNSISIGTYATTNSANGIAMGYAATGGVEGVAIGYNAKATGHGIAIGLNTNANGDFAIAIGQGMTGGIATNTISIGRSASASGSGAVVIGQGASSNASNTITIGNSSKVGAVNSVAVGYGANASVGQCTVAIGAGATTTSNFAVAIGQGSNAGLSTVAIGRLANAAANKVVIGYNAHGETSVGFEASSSANGVAMGYMAKSAGYMSVAVGSNVNCPKPNSVAIGANANIGGSGRAIAIGANAFSTAKNSNYTDQIAIGCGAKVYGASSIAIGSYANAGLSTNDTTRSIAIGYGAEVNGNYSIVIGGGSKIGLNSNTSIAIGSNVTCANNCASMLLMGTNITSYYANASGSVAIGSAMNGIWTNTVAIGIGLSAKSGGSTYGGITMLGTYNSFTINDIFEIGNGTGDAAANRSTAFRITTNGDVIATGDIIDGNGNKLSDAGKSTVKTATLTAGNTTVTFTDVPTTGDCIVDFSTSLGVNYTAINITGGTVSLAFPVQASDMTVYCEIREV